MAAISIFRSPNGLKINEDTLTTFLSNPVIQFNEGANSQLNTITITSGAIIKSLLIRNIVSIQGDAPQPVVDNLLNQIAALLGPAPSVGEVLPGRVQITSSVLPALAATETKQDQQLTYLDRISTFLGTMDADAAETDFSEYSLMAFVKRLQTKLPELSNGSIRIKQVLLDSGNIQLSTLAAGATFVSFPNVQCTQVTISNASGVTIDVRQGGAGDSMQIPNNTVVYLHGLTNANQLAVRRTDQAAAVVKITGRWEF